MSSINMVELAHWPIRTAIKADWFYPVMIVAGGATLRLAFFSGGLGTDEIVYLSQAHHLLSGDFNPAGYLGAIRYGINAFQALSLCLFGNGVTGAAGLYFACSLASILLCYGFAYHLWGRRAAIWASLALTVLPIDVTLAGSLNPDPYLSLTISASIIVFLFRGAGRPGGLVPLSAASCGLGVLDKGGGSRLRLSLPLFRLAATPLAGRLALVPAWRVDLRSRRSRLLLGSLRGSILSIRHRP